MTNEEYWTTAELREFLRLGSHTKDRTWYRLKPFFAPALVTLPHHKLYAAAKVRALLEGARSRTSPLRRSRVVQAVA